LQLLLVNWAHATYDIDDAILYRVSFNEFGAKSPLNGDLNQKSPDEIKLHGYSSKVKEPEPGSDVPSTVIPDHSDMKLKNPLELEEDEVDTIPMLTRHGEKYVCTIPRTDGKDKEKDSKNNYEGQTALALLEPLFVSQSCAYRLEHYWTYELCHGRFLRQYHEERDGKTIKLDEYFLGKYDMETYQKAIEAAKEQVKSGKIKKPQKKRVESMNMPYLELKMTSGTICDLNGLPRMARIQYVCYPSGKHEMYSFKETSTCEYEVMVLSPLLCSHPDYRPESANEQHINCKPADKETATKPQDLVKTEKENYKMLTKNKMYEADFFQGTKGPGSVKIEIKPVNPFGETSSEAAQEKREEESLKDSSRWRESTREPAKPLTDPQIVRDFLMGDHCLYGGTGWWKYEFCYGKTVKQYHEEKGERVQLINLGHFDKSKHIKWLSENPSKVPKKAEFRKHVSHFYSGGDFCELSGKPREIEVKLKCKQSQSLSAVTLYLLEPKTCEYILGVESPLICDILNRADEHGIMEVYPAMDKDIITDDETLDELVEKAGKSDSTTTSPPHPDDQFKTKATTPRPILGESSEPPKPSAPPSDPQKEGIPEIPEKYLTSSESNKDTTVTAEDGNFISKEELIRDINSLLKMKFNQKTKEQLDVDTLRKISKGKLAELLEEAYQEDVSSDSFPDSTLKSSKKFRKQIYDKLYDNLKSVRFEHREGDNDNSDDTFESDPFDDFDDSPDYDDDELEELNDE